MIDRDRPNAAQKAGASLMTRVDAAEGAGSSPRRLAESGGTAALSALGSRSSGESQLRNPFDFRRRPDRSFCVRTLGCFGGSAHRQARGIDRLSDDPVISIIDDDESVRTGLASLVRSLGLAAQTFAGADEFLQSHGLDDAGCLIIDVQMPGTGGLELQQGLAAHGRRLPIIFITAHPEGPHPRSGARRPARFASSANPSPPKS